MLGTAVGVGVSTHYTNRKYQQGIDPTIAASESAKAQLNEAAKRGLVIHPDFEGDAATLAGLAANGVRKFIDKDPIPLGWEIISIEQDLGEAYGNCRPDLLVRLPHGELMVIDLKTKRTLEARYYQRTLDEYRNSWQQKHYCWAVGEVYQENVYQYAIMLVVLEPTFRVVLDQTVLDEELLTRWLQSAMTVWGIMDTATPYEAAEHYDRYGRCPWYEACFEYRLVPALMRQHYVEKTWR